MRSKVLFVGNGWRTQYYLRVIDELKEEIQDVKEKLASGEQPVFDNVEALFEYLEAD